MSPIPTVQNVVAISTQFFPSSMLRTIAAITVVFAALTCIVQAICPTCRAAVVADRLSVAQQSFNDVITGDRFRLVEPAKAEDFARRLRALEDIAEKLRTETLEYGGSSVWRRWWKEFCGCCSGRSLALWRCGRDLARLHHLIEAERQAGRNRFNAEVARVNSPLIELALRQAYAKPSA
ncbi:hypothetical protein B0H19DRAFT_1073938 [Mycena capillaripes]|nr:hypothetical protein B0H19DRAFT_1073938 [Mycena capillaripes]